MNDGNQSNHLTDDRLPELDEFDNFYNGLVINEVLSLKAAIDGHKTTSKERENEEEDEAESSLKNTDENNRYFGCIKHDSYIFVYNTDV